MIFKFGKKVRISLVVCVSPSFHIGLNNELLGHVEGDLKHFKELTLGQHIIMGYKTALSLPRGRPLPERVNHVIIERRQDKEGSYEHMVRAYELVSKRFRPHISLKEAVRKASKSARASIIEPEIFIIGGAATYRQALKELPVDRVYLTMANSLPSNKGDVTFPDLLRSEEYGKWDVKAIDTLNDNGDLVYRLEKTGFKQLTREIAGDIVKSFKEIF